MPEPNTYCFICKKALHRRISQLERSGGRAFCSRKCIDELRKHTRRTYTCAVCNTNFWPIRKSQKFCSRQCSSMGRRGTKYDRHDFRGNNRSERIANLFEQAGMTPKCMIKGCSYNKTFDAHRFVPGKSSGTYDDENIFAICPNHHAEIHRGVIEVAITGKYELTIIKNIVESQLEKYIKIGRLNVRNGRGEENNGHKIKESQVREIRQLRKEGRLISDLAHMYGLHKNSISDILSRRTWAHVL